MSWLVTHRLFLKAIATVFKINLRLIPHIKETSETSRLKLLYVKSCIYILKCLQVLSAVCMCGLYMWGIYFLSWLTEYCSRVHVRSEKYTFKLQLNSALEYVWKHLRQETGNTMREFWFLFVQHCLVWQLDLSFMSCWLHIFFFLLTFIG